MSLYDTIQRRVHDAETKSQDKRTLRSHDDGGRLKSELAVYFPNYLDVINDTPREPGRLEQSQNFAIAINDDFQNSLHRIPF